MLTFQQLNDFLLIKNSINNYEKIINLLIILIIEIIMFIFVIKTQKNKENLQRQFIKLNSYFLIIVIMDNIIKTIMRTFNINLNKKYEIGIIQNIYTDHTIDNIGPLPLIIRVNRFILTIVLFFLIYFIIKNYKYKQKKLSNKISILLSFILTIYMIFPKNNLVFFKNATLTQDPCYPKHIYFEAQEGLVTTPIIHTLNYISAYQNIFIIIILIFTALITLYQNKKKK